MKLANCSLAWPLTYEKTVFERYCLVRHWSQSVFLKGDGTREICRAGSWNTVCEQCKYDHVGCSLLRAHIRITWILCLVSHESSVRFWVTVVAETIFSSGFCILFCNLISYTFNKRRRYEFWPGHRKLKKLEQSADSCVSGVWPTLEWSSCCAVLYSLTVTLTITARKPRHLSDFSHAAFPSWLFVVKSLITSQVTLSSVTARSAYFTGIVNLET